MSDDAELAVAREWLERFLGMYEGMDTKGSLDPVHAARVRAQELLDAGPTVEDPLTIANMMAAALPLDPRAVGLADDWREKLARVRGTD
jgi:hypothetical protein